MANQREIEDLKNNLKFLEGKMANLDINLPSMKLEKFKGKWDNRDFHAFLKEFYQIGNMHSWTEQSCCRILPAYLLNDAAAAYDSLSIDAKRNWKKLCDGLADKLSYASNLPAQRRKLFEIRQNKDETALEFGMKIKELVARAFPDGKGYTEDQRESIAVDHFINGLRIEFQEQIIRKNPQKFVEALEIARAEEGIQKRKENNLAQNELRELREQINKMNEK